jgi:hypothetical protein
MRMSEAGGSGGSSPGASRSNPASEFLEGREQFLEAGRS